MRRGGSSLLGGVIKRWRFGSSWLDLEGGGKMEVVPGWVKVLCRGTKRRRRAGGSWLCRRTGRRRRGGGS